MNVVKVESLKEADKKKQGGDEKEVEKEEEKYKRWWWCSPCEMPFSPTPLSRVCLCSVDQPRALLCKLTNPPVLFSLLLF